MKNIFVFCGCVTLCCLFLFAAGSAQVPPHPILPPTSLKTVSVPEPPNLMGLYVANRAAAIRLGKALFWDMQMGSDNVQACASCHFHAGADNRAKNQLSPGLNAGDLTFALGHGPNSTVGAADFPRPKANNDVTSSQGVFNTNFVGLEWPSPMAPIEARTLATDAVFHVNGVQTRRVEPRNTPTVINAVFNFRNFWDGRANFTFSGTNPFGDRAIANGAVVYMAASGNKLVPHKVNLDGASLASQADGPPGSDFEMSAIGRTFQHIGRKLLAAKPLGLQNVSPQDGVLGSLAITTGPNPKGLNTTYEAMIKAAFKSQWWSSTAKINGWSQMELNFGLFFGIAVQMYEATLVSNDSKFDKVMDQPPTATFTAQEQRGFDLFMSRGRCINCHGGAEFTNASVRNVTGEAIERMMMGDGGVAVYDNGFYNIGVRATNEDIGVGGTDPWGNPLSFARQIVNGPKVDTRIPFDTTIFEVRGPIVPGERVAVDGAFKTPTLRNVELTGPYFHNGGQATLRQVVAFYNRGGDFGQENEANLDPDIQPLGLTDDEMNDLVAFLLTLTDERVRWKKAPFDHPELIVPNGHPVDNTNVPSFAAPEGNRAQDDFLVIPAVGRNGAPVALQPFLNLNPMSKRGGEVAQDVKTTPQKFALEQNYPNPFNPSTTIRYSIPEAQRVRLSVYNTLGQEVQTLVNETQDAGTYSIRFNASNLASGMYIYRIQAGSFIDSKKLILIK